MILHLCDQCRRQSPGGPDVFNTGVLPDDWIEIIIQGLTRIVCSWGCGETLCRRMSVNEEHPGDDVVHRVPPARADTADLDEGADPKTEYAPVVETKAL